jgi:hypothetical protein
MCVALWENSRYVDVDTAPRKSNQLSFSRFILTRNFLLPISSLRCGDNFNSHGFYCNRKLLSCGRATPFSLAGDYFERLKTSWFERLPDG